MNRIIGLAVCLSFSCCFHSIVEASTQVGEMVVLESSGPNEPAANTAGAPRFQRTLKTRMLFREYFSSPSMATPQDEFSSTGSGGAWKPNQTMFFVDGRPVRYDIGAGMLKPGAIIYYFINRRIPQYISVHTHARPISGRLVSNKDKKLVVRRLISRKFESSGVVYIDQQVEIADNARFLLDGVKSIEGKCLTEGRLIRVLAAQPLTISAFTNEAVLTTDQFHKIHGGTRAGFLTKTDTKVHTIKSLGKDGWKEEQRSGGTGLLDGQFMFDSTPVLQAGNQVTAFCYRGSTDRCVFVIGRSKAVGAMDGEITKLDNENVTVRIHPDMTERTWTLDSATRFRVNGQDVVVDALKVGMKVTLFDRRPQVVDAWTLPPVVVPEDQQMIVYGVDGKKSVVREGRLPKRIQDNLDKAKKD